jgi:chemotaxis protein MotB
MVPVTFLPECRKWSEMHEPQEEKPEGAPEWMVSYADMITIIMSFFVIMFALASGEAAKGKKMREATIESFQYRFGPQWKPFMSWTLAPGNSLLPGGGKGQGSPDSIPAVGDPGGTVRKSKREKARLRVKGEGELLAIGGLVHFNDGNTDLLGDRDQGPTMQTIANELAGKPQPIEIVATASKRPLPPGCPYHDRWELGYARCRRVAEILPTLKIYREKESKGTERADSPTEELTSLKIDPARFRITIMPASAEENAKTLLSDADSAVQVNLSNSLSADGR